MKTTLLFIAALVVSFINTSAQSFTLGITPPEAMLKLGESAIFTVSVQPVGGFEATIFLTVESSRPGVDLKLSSNTINTPYPNVTLTARAISDTGTIVITLTGSNGPNNKNTAKVTLQVSKDPQWKVVSSNIEAGLWGERIIRGKGGTIVAIYPGTLAMYVHTFEGSQWESNKIDLQTNFNDSHGWSRYHNDMKGNLWATEMTGSLYRFNNGQITVWTEADGLSGSLRDFLFDNVGTPIIHCIESDTIVLRHYIDGEWRQLYKHSDIKNRTHVEPSLMCLDSTGAIWTPIDGGVVRIKGTDSVEITPENSEIGDSFIRDVFCDRLGRIWCVHGTKDGYASVLTDTTWSRIEFPRPTALEIDSKNNIWVGSGKQLFMFDGSKWIKYDSTNSPLSDRIQCLVADKNDNIWVAYNKYNASDNGLARAGVIFNPDGLKGIPLVLSAEEPEIPAFGVFISPNPATESFSVHCPEGASITVKDVFGKIKTMNSRAINGTAIISTVDYPSGIYFVEVMEADGQRVIQKVVISR